MPLHSHFAYWYSIFMRAQAVLELGNRNAGFAHLCHGIKMAFISLRDRHHNKQMQKMWKFYNAEFCLCYLTEFVFSRNVVIRPDAFHTMMYTHQSRTCYSSRTEAWTLTSHRCKQLPKLKSRRVLIWHILPSMRNAKQNRSVFYGYFYFKCWLERNMEMSME